MKQKKDLDAFQCLNADFLNSISLKKYYLCKGEAEFDEVRGVKEKKTLKRVGMMQMKDKSGNTGSVEYNKSQSAGTKPNVRGGNMGRK